jgi:hypothetical protein
VSKKRSPTHFHFFGILVFIQMEVVASIKWATLTFEEGLEVAEATPESAVPQVHRISVQVEAQKHP